MTIPWSRFWPTMLIFVTLMGLVSCGGGGGGGGPKTTIMPPDSRTPDHSDTLAGASDIVPRQTVEGYIDSPGDVDYFRLRLTEPGIVTVTLDLELAGVEVSLLDGGGNVLATAETGSTAIIRYVVENAVEYFLKVVLTDQTFALTDLLKDLLPVKYRLLVEALSIPQAGAGLVKIKQGAPLVGFCRCLAIVEPEGEIKEINLNDHFEGPTGETLKFTVRGEIPESLRVNLDGATGRLAISAPRGADLGIHRFRLTVEEKDNPETYAVFTAKVNVAAMPRLLPGQSLTVDAEPGKRTSIDLTGVIGAPANVGQHPPLWFDLNLTEEVRSLSARLERLSTRSPRYLVIEPPSDLGGEFALTVSAWFLNGRERSKDFTFQVVVETLGPLWIRAENVDCHVHFETLSHLRIPGVTGAYSYSGECRGRKTHGQGTVMGGPYNVPANGPGTVTGGPYNVRYEGEWNDGRASGQGIHSWGPVDDPDGLGKALYFVLEGEFLDGRLHGRGIETQRMVLDGRTIVIRTEGEWRHGLIWNGITIAPFPFATVIWRNGECFFENNESC